MISLCIWGLLFLFGYIYWRSCQNARQQSEKKLPPGTMGWPVIGETLEFARKKVEFFKERHEIYGRIYKTSLFGKSIIRVSGAENIRQITTGENKIVRSSYPASVQKLLGNTSIAMSNGEVHQIRKQQLQKYLCPDYLNRHVPVLASMISERLQAWCQMPEVDLYTECRKLFIELATKFLIRIDIEDEDVVAVREVLDIFNENMFCLPVNLPGFGFYKALKAKTKLKQIIVRILNQPSLNNNDDDQLPSLLEGIRKYEGNVDIETEDEMLTAIVELLFSGSETVSSAGFSLALNLIKNQEVSEKLKKDLTTQGLQSQAETVSAHDLNAMAYVQAVVKETLRVLPPIGGAYRTAIESFELDGYTVPKGWSVVYSIRETHNTDIYVANPLTFNPDQWLEPGFSLDKYSYAPFGAGARVCPGQAYAKMILKLFAVEFSRTCTTNLLQDSEFELWPTPRPSGKVLVDFKRL